MATEKSMTIEAGVDSLLALKGSWVEYTDGRWLNLQKAVKLIADQSMCGSYPIIRVIFDGDWEESIAFEQGEVEDQAEYAEQVLQALLQYLYKPVLINPN